MLNLKIGYEINSSNLKWLTEQPTKKQPANQQTPLPKKKYKQTDIVSQRKLKIGQAQNKSIQKIYKFVEYLLKSL